MNTLLIIISLLITVAFLGIITYLFGVLWSISESFYRLEKRRKGSGILFTLWTFLAGFPLAYAWFNISKGQSFQFLVFFACGSLMMLGAASQFRQKMTDKVHYISAAICVASALAWLILAGFWFIPLITFMICIPIAIADGKWIFWIEIAALVATFTTLLMIENATLITTYFTRFIY